MTPLDPDSETRAERTDYWDNVYAETDTSRLPLPSQFAAFVAGELAELNRVVEFGSGSARDAVFFASYGHTVLGVDASEQAVDHSRALVKNLGITAEFLAASIGDAGIVDRIGRGELPTVVYARFFIHAITDEEEERFLAVAAAITQPGDMLAVEYRTVRDRSGTKVTGRHYRRFVQPASFESRALDHGFDVTYAVEGFGFAKYHDDDAYVARTIFSRR
jgi:cyclopropane fatty-acyl-phospholipid synthase-like methyltransferase